MIEVLPENGSSQISKPYLNARKTNTSSNKNIARKNKCSGAMRNIIEVMYFLNVKPKLSEYACVTTTSDNGNKEVDERITVSRKLKLGETRRKRYVEEHHQKHANPSNTIWG